MDYKDTLNLATSDFPMRGNLPQSEPPTYQQWRDNDMFSQMHAKRKDANASFTLHDGPPYANGHLHIGHALNKILKDIIVKYHYFQGKRAYYTPGWDCHGLPIEQQIEQNIGSEAKAKLTKREFRDLCRKHATEFVAIQSGEFQSFGVLGDFGNPYITMDFAFEAKIFESLCEIAKSGILAQRHKPIYWSWACQTALAEAEVEYKDKESYSIFVAFPLKDSALAALGVNRAKIIIWTTTPWTLPANVAIALKDGEDYVLTNDDFIVARKCYETMCEKLNLGAIAKEFKSNILENLTATNPLNGRDSTLVLGDYISVEEGSGAVHTAPGHGEDDYYMGLKYDLECIMPVDDYGNFDETIIAKKLLPEEFLGRNVFQAQRGILELLGDALLKEEKITHSYPHCWRSHKPVIYRATTQWFILMDKPFFEGKTLRQITLDEIQKVDFYPKSGYKRLKAMIETRPDWCISRQRDWGVPIAFFIDKASGEPLFEREILEFVRGIFEKEGCNAWWEREIKDLLPPKYAHLAGNLEKSEHILDVWFDSGSTWNAVLDTPKYRAGSYPADLYLEGSDQHRGWFQSSLLVSCAIRHRAPFRGILTHGFTVDEHDEKMSKSKGNIIAPQAILQSYGSEILRLWVAMSDYQSDLKISQNILKQISENYRKVRNTLRFLLANTNDLPVLVAKDALGEIDKWILNRANAAFSEANALFGEYEFSKAFGVVMGFLVNDLSGIYVDLCKDSLYCDRTDSTQRRAIQTTLCLIVRKLLAFLAPVLTYSVDEAIKCAPKVLKGAWESVFDVRDSIIDYDMKNEVDFDELLEIRTAFSVELDRLKKEKIIKSSLELSAACEHLSQEMLAKWLIVSEMGDSENSANSEILATLTLKNGKIIKILKSARHKCPRCWQFTSNAEDTLCARCEKCLESEKS